MLNGFNFAINKNSGIDFSISLFVLLLLSISILLDVNTLIVLITLFAYWSHVFYISFVKYHSLVSIRSLFLFGNFFVYAIPILYISAFHDWVWVSYKFSPVEINKNDLLTIVLLVSSGITSFLFGYSLCNIKMNSNKDSAFRYHQFLLGLVVFSFIIISIRRIELFYFVLNNGFYAIYTEGFKTSFVESALAYVFYITAPTLFFLSQSNVVKKFIISLILFEGVLHSFGGQRVWILFALIQCFYLLSFHLSVDIRSKLISRFFHIIKLSFLLFFSIYIMSFILHIREGVNFDFRNFSIIDYFIGQFGTIVGLNLAISNFDFSYASNIPVILDTINVYRNPIQDTFDPNTANVGSRVTYLACSSCFQDGRSYGNSIYMQLYEFGSIGIVLGCTLIGIFARYLDLNKNTNIYIPLVGFFICKHILWMARGEFFPHYINLTLIFVTLFFTMLVTKNYRWSN